MTRSTDRTMQRAVLDHVAIGTRTLTDGWQLFAGLLGGTWVYGGDSPGYWWGQLRFAKGPKIELLTPASSAGGAFLERFLTSRGPGPHHVTFLVGDIGRTLSAARNMGIEPVGVDLSNPAWQEAFLHPRDAHGIVVQIARQSGTPTLAAPAELPDPGPASAFALLEHRVTDLSGATKLFSELLDGELVTSSDPNGAAVADLTWKNGIRLRLIGPAAGAAGPTTTQTTRTHLHFTRHGTAFSRAELSRAADLAGRLGTSLRLSDSAE
ncbi:MAG TPA: VOC family protein [Streptosporangiaceae bacterium]|nr:VOC family protein [Streptosporangiaceae bacterium]